MKAQQGKSREVRVHDDARFTDRAVVKTVKVSPTSERILQEVKKRRAEALKILADR